MALLARIGSEIYLHLVDPPSFCLCHFSKAIETFRLLLIDWMSHEQD